MDHGRQKSTGNAGFTLHACPSCGSDVLVPQQSPGSFCHLCESFTHAAGVKPSAGGAVPDALSGAAHAIAAKDYAAALAKAEALAGLSDPLALYGLGSIYMVLSDYTYNDVNYALPGFMDANAGKKSNEPGINKYNSMALMAKSKELLFTSLYILRSKAGGSGREFQFPEFLVQMKLRRMPQAAKALERIAGGDDSGAASEYAKMAYAAKTGDRHAAERISPVLKAGHLNALYYNALHLINHNRRREAKASLSLMLDRVASPMALDLMAKLAEAEEVERL